MKKISKKTFDEIINKHLLFNIAMPPSKALEINKAIKETAIDYIVDDYFIFDEEKEIIESINHLTYLQVQELEKNPPFIFTAMLKLMNPKDLSLASYYAEPLVNDIMSEIKSKATQYVNENEVLKLRFNFSSPDVIVTSHMDIPSYFQDILLEQLSESKMQLNTESDRINFTVNVLNKYGYLYLFTNQNNILAFQENNGITFGEINENNNIPYNEVRERYGALPTVSTDSSLIIIEKNKVIEMIAKDIGEDKALEVVNEFLEESPYTQFKVQPGSYVMSFKLNLTPLKNPEQKIDDDIDVLFELKGIKLDNDLQVSRKVKI